jgi:flagellar hook-associated protein 3 FlgL
MRVSTFENFSTSATQMDNLQSQINTLYQEISSGQDLTTPSDNPTGAAQAVQLSATSAALSQYETNQTSAQSSLQIEDQTLSSVNTTLNSIYSLVMEAGNGVLTDSNRTAIATQMQGDLQQLVTLSNTTDGAGNYIFAGFKAGTQPFTTNPDGSVSYQGDAGTRTVQVSQNTSVAETDNGASVFLSVPGIGSAAVPAAGANNTGSGTIGAVSVTNTSAAGNQDPYTITIGGSSAAPTYTITDGTTGTTSAAQAFTAGAAISLGGESVTISGTPNAGDTFSVTPATQSTTNVFSIVNSIISALKTPVASGTAGQATLSNALATLTTQLQNSMSNVQTVQASVGGREQQIKAIQSVTSTSALQTSNSLSNLTSTDMTSAISQYELLQNTLSAAQKAFVQVTQMSLFQYMSN